MATVKDFEGAFKHALDAFVGKLNTLATAQKVPHTDVLKCIEQVEYHILRGAPIALGSRRASAKKALQQAKLPHQVEAEFLLLKNVIAQFNNQVKESIQHVFYEHFYDASNNYHPGFEYVAGWGGARSTRRGCGGPRGRSTRRNSRR